MDGCTKDPQLEEGKNLNTRAPGTERTPPGGTSAPARQTQGGPSPAFVKENIDVLRTMIKELDNKGQEKEGTLLMGPLGQGAEVGLDLLRKIKSVSRKKEISKSHRSVRSKVRSRSKSKSVKSKPQSARAPRRKSSLDSGMVQDVSPDLEWFSKELKMYEKDPTEIHGIKQRPNEGLQAFMDRFKVESVHIKGVPPVLRISAFMHGHGHPELAKKLNDKIPKTIDEIWERFKAFIRGEIVADTTEFIRSLRWEKSAGFIPLTKIPKEILSMDNVNFPLPPSMVGTPEKRKINKFCDYHQDRGHNTNDCYHLKKQIEEAVALGRLAHLVKDIKKGGQKSKGSAKGKEKVINMVRSQGYRKRPYERVEHWMDNANAITVKRIHVDGGSSLKVMYEHCFRNLSYQTRSRLRESRIPLVRFSGEVSYPMGVIDLEVTIETTISTTRETLRKCRQIKEAQDLSRHARVTDPTPMQTSSDVANPRVLLASVEARSQRPGNEPMQLDDMEERRQLDKGRKLPKSGAEEKIVVNDNYPEQLVTIRGGLSAECMHALIHTLRNNVDIFTWTPTDMTGIPRRKVVTDEVKKWLKAGIVKRVRYPTWVANPVLVKKVDGSWRMCIDFKDLNKAYTKDLYPLPEINWKIESLMGFQYKCFLDAYKGYHQIQMTKKDEQKATFHTKEGVFCYMKMPFGLKNVGATYQRLVESTLKEQIGVNLEAYVDDMVIKSRTEQDIIKDIEQIFSTLRRINMKINLTKCLFGMKEGKFLGYIVTSEGIRANPEKEKVVMDMPSPKTIKQMQSLSGKLAALDHFLSKGRRGSVPGDKEVANEAVSAVLLTKRDGRQMPIHYVSRSLQGAETNYAPMEKLGLALVHTARRLRRYFQAYPIKVITDSPIGQVLNNSGASGRHPNRDKCYTRGGQHPRMKDIPESSNTRENLTPSPRAWRLYTDGASNNGGSGAGLILIAPYEVEYSYVLCLNFSNSNNEAEYEALLVGLRIATEMQVKDVHAFVDFKLVASQVEGLYEAKGERMKKYREKVLELAGAFNRFRIPAIIITNNGTQFVNDPFKKWAEKLKIQLIYTLVYHPHDLHLNLDLLDKQSEIAAIREARYKQQVEKYYNKKGKRYQGPDMLVTSEGATCKAPEYLCLYCVSLPERKISKYRLSPEVTLDIIDVLFLLA
nr:hypothetical protein [Tanacetum cinerariifolium]